MPNTENLRKLHSSLSGLDKGFTRTYEEFETDMQDEAKRAKLHQSLSSKSKGFNRTYDEFNSDMGFDTEQQSPTVPLAFEESKAVVHGDLRGTTKVGDITLDNTINRWEIENQFPRNDKNIVGSVDQTMTDVIVGKTKQAKQTDNNILTGKDMQENPIQAKSPLEGIDTVNREQETIKALTSTYDSEQIAKEDAANRGKFIDYSDAMQEERGFWSTTAGDFAQSAYAGAADLVGNTIGFLNNLPSYVTGLPTPDKTDAQRVFNEVAELVRRKSYDDKNKTFVDYWKDGDYSHVAEDIFVKAGESAPLIVSIMLTGGASGMVQAGGTSMQSQYDRLRDNPEISEDSKRVNAMLYGTVDAVSELLGSIPVANMIKKTVAKTGKDAVLESITKTIRTSIDNMLDKAGPATKVIFPTIGEGLEEFTAQVGQNIVGFATGEIKDFKPFEGAFESFIYGAGAGSGMSAITAGALINQNIQTPKDALREYEKRFKDKKESYIESIIREYNYDKSAFVERDIEDLQYDINYYTEILKDNRIKLASIDGVNQYEDIDKKEIKYFQKKLVESNKKLASAKSALEAIKAIDSERENQIRTAATEAINQVDSTINPETGTIVMAEINGQPTPITGNVVFLEDGTIDIENSAETLSYKDEEGNVIPITAKELVNAAQIDAIQARTEAVSAATGPIIQQQKNEDAPEFEVGEYVRHENGMLSGEITAKTDNGYMVKSLTQGEVEVQGGNLINDKHVSGLKSKEEVEYTENGETKVGIVDDIESGRSKGTIDLLVEVNGKQIPKTVNYDQIVGKKVEKEVESAEVPAESTDKMIVEPSADETLSDKQTPEAGIPATEEVVEPEIEPETKQEPEAPTEPEKTPTYNEQIPKKKVGKKTVTDYESVAPGITLGALREDFEDSDIKELVSTKIKDIEKQIKAVGEVKKIADFDLYKANVKAAKEKVDNLNKQLEYWNSVKEEAKPKNKVEVAEIPIRESRDERYDRWGEPRSLRELIMYHFVGGMKLRWNDIKTDDGKVLSRGMGAEYRYDNGERLTRIGLTSNDGLTPEQYADKLWGANGYEKGSFEEMDLSGEDTTSILNEIQYILNEYVSTGQMIAAINEDRAQLSKEEQAYLDQAIFEADNDIDNLSDDIYAAVLGLTEFTEEQLNELNNILQNETNETTEGTSPTAIEETESIESDNEGQGSEGVVEVTLFKKGEGGTKGLFQDKDGNLYKSLIQTYLAFEDGVAVRKDAEGISKEYDILKALQGNPRVPIIGKKVETSEGTAFEIEKLDEVESLTFDEYEQIRDILNDLNNQGYFVNDTVTVMRRPATGQLVIVDFSAGRYDKKLIGNSTFSDLSFTSRLRQMMSEADQKKANAKRDQEEIDLWSEIEAESAKKKADKELESLEAEYNSKSVEELVALKKQLYSDMDIESPKSAEEKLLEKVIADKFSDINKAVSEKRKAKKALEAEAAMQEQFNEQSRPSIDFNNWKWEKASSNAIVIRPNTVGKPFTDEQFNTVMQWGKNNNFTPIRNSRNTRIEFVVDKLDNALVDYLDSVSVKAINDKKAADEKAKKDEAEKARKEELRNTVNSNPATSWINREFGEDAMNDYNKNALAKFLNGDTKTFEGQVNNKWADVITRLNALTEDGKGVDFAKLKKAYEQSEAAEQEQMSVEDIYEQSKTNIAIVNKKGTTKLQAYEIGHEIGMQIKNAGLSKEARSFIAGKKDINAPLNVLPYLDGLYDGFRDKTDNKARYEVEQEQIASNTQPTFSELESFSKEISNDFKGLVEYKKTNTKDVDGNVDGFNIQVRQNNKNQMATNKVWSFGSVFFKEGAKSMEDFYIPQGRSKKSMAQIAKNDLIIDFLSNFDPLLAVIKGSNIDDIQRIVDKYSIDETNVLGKELMDNVRSKMAGAKDMYVKKSAKAIREEIISDIANKKIDAVEGVKKLDELKNDEVRFAVADNFYSTVERALGKINQDKGTKAQFKAMLLNNGAKQAEMDWMGFDELPEKLTKGDIQNWIDENRIEVKEVEKGSNKDWTEKKDVWTRDNGKNKVRIVKITETQYVGTASKLSRNFKTLDEAKEYYDGVQGYATDTKYTQYQLPGGENYKELLLTMPVKGKTITVAEKEELENLQRRQNNEVNFPENDLDRLKELMQKSRDSFDNKDHFKSSHFDEPNILAHIRFNERTVNGERVLFLEELQSDFAQKGKKEGFKSEKDAKRLHEEYKIFAEKMHAKYSFGWESKLNAEESAENQRIEKAERIAKTSSVPDMPFKKTDQWLNLSIRRMMRYAAENGFDRIAWTNGEQQYNRYPEQDSETETAKTRSAGMKAFYDAIVPSAMSKLGKPFGAKVENIGLKQDTTKGEVVKDELTGKYDVNLNGEIIGKDFLNYSEANRFAESNKKTNYSTQQSIPVTDSMKETAMAGFPLFKRSDKNEKATQQRIEGVKGIIAQLNKDNGTDAIVADTNEEFIELVPAEYADYIRKHEIGGIFYRGDVIINAEMIESNDKVMSVYEHEYAHIATAANFTRKQLSELWNEVSDSDKALLPGAYRNESDYVKADELISHAVEDIIEKQGYENYKNGNIDLSLYSEPLQNKLKTVIENANRNYLRNVQKGNEGRNTNGNDNAKGTSQDLFGATGNGQTPELGREDNGLSEQVKGALPATITINGVERPTTNSLGKPIHSTEQGVRNFYAWFGESKVVDSEGMPLVVYHGSGNGNFNVFDASKGNPVLNGGMYFSDSKALSDKFAGPEGNVFEVYLKIETPKYGTFSGSGADMQNSEYRDGGIFTKNNTDKYANKGDKEYIVFSPTQIKSANFNDGTFDPDNADIRFAILGEKGAAALDAEEEATTKLDNLRVAKEMEATKTPQEIRLATGWERGIEFVSLFKERNAQQVLDYIENLGIIKKVPC